MAKTRVFLPKTQQQKKSTLPYRHHFDKKIHQNYSSSLMEVGGTCWKWWKTICWVILYCSKGRYARSRIPTYEKDWPENGVTIEEMKAFVRSRSVTDLFGPGPFREKFPKEWFGNGGQGKILIDTVLYEFKLLNALYRAHTVEDEKALR